MKKRRRRSFGTVTRLCTNNVHIERYIVYIYITCAIGLWTGTLTFVFSLTPSFAMRFSGKDESDDSDDKGKAKKKDDSGDDESSASGKRNLEALQPQFSWLNKTSPKRLCPPHFCLLIYNRHALIMHIYYEPSLCWTYKRTYSSLSKRSKQTGAPPCTMPVQHFDF